MINDCFIVTNEQLENLKQEPYYPVVNIGTGSLYYVKECKQTDKSGTKKAAKKINVAVWLSVDITVISVICDENNCVKTLEVEVTLTDGSIEAGEIKTEYLHSRKISEILQYGWIYEENYSKVLVDYLKKNMSNVPTKVRYNSVGWKLIDEKLTFRTKNVLIDSEYYDNDYIYGGDMNFDSKVTADDYLTELNDLLITEGSEFAVVTGLASVMVARVKMFTEVDNTMVHIYGSSSKGKTTFIHIATSMWGDPIKLKHHWNATENAMYSVLSDNYGVVVGFDEASAIKYNISDLIYSISNGCDKLRCNKDSTIKESLMWSTILVTTAEKSLLELCDKNDGLGVRCLEFYNLKVSKDREHADKLNKFVRKNYGLLGEEFAGFILDMNEQQLENDFREILTQVDDVLEQVSPDKKLDITDRCSKIYSVFILTAYYAKQIGVHINNKSILKILVKHYKGLISESKTEKVYNAVMTYIFNNGKRIANSSNIKDADNNYDGYYYNNHYYLVESVFESILVNCNIQDRRNTLKSLCDDGYMIKTKDRFYHKKTINNKVIKFYMFPDKKAMKKMLCNTKGGNNHE